MKRVAQPSPIGVDDGIVDEGGSRPDRFGLSPILRIASGIILLCFLTHSSEPALARDCKDPATIIGVSSADELVLDHPIEGTTTVRLAGIDPPELTARSDRETVRSPRRRCRN